MGNTQHEIEITRKAPIAAAQRPMQHATAVQRPSGRYVDGFYRTGRTSANAAPSTLKPIAKPVKKQAHQAGVHLNPHKPEPARTLMRSAVKKPDLKTSKSLAATSRTDILAKTPVTSITPKLSHTAVDPQRAKKAAQMIKSPKVSRYGAAPTIVTASHPSPISAQSLHITASSSKTSSIDSIHDSLSKLKVRPANIPVSEMRQAAPAKDLFSEALARATSHEAVHEPAIRADHRRRRAGLLVTASLSALLLVGVYAYFNTAALTMRVASVRAGFSAKLPNYSPDGFRYGSLSYGPGNITVNYASATDSNKKYDITQRASDWDSQTLLSNFVQSAGNAYQTYQQAGRTVYLYGNNTATWVDSGVWYTVDGNNSLNRDQLLDLARSL